MLWVMASRAHGGFKFSKRHYGSGKVGFVIYNMYCEFSLSLCTF